MAADFSGKVALVTGAASGIGRNVAEAFAARGANVVLADLDAVKGETVCDHIRQSGGKAIFVRTDVTRDADVRALIDAVLAAHGRIDIAHNNAGAATPPALTADVEEEVFDRAIATNLKSVWLCMKHEIPAMLAGGGGAIINSSSVLGLVGTSGGAPYVAAKHGVAGLTRTAAIEYAARGIRVNAICPGYVRTPLLEEALADPGRAAAITGLHPARRLAEVHDIAGAVLWLASADAGFVTGAMIPIDGGMTAQ